MSSRFSWFTKLLLHRFLPLVWVLVTTGILGCIQPTTSLLLDQTLQNHSNKLRRRVLPMSSLSDTDNNNNQNVVIAGAGIMGLTTAYYLAKDFGLASTLVDPASDDVAPAASGKAGGFLALDWNDYAPVGPLARRSFQLHQELANGLGADRIQYRRLTCAAASVGAGNQQKPQGKKLEGVEWAQGIVGMRPMGDESTIAQVHPKLLCSALWEECQRLKPECRIVQGKVTAAVASNEDSSRLLQVQLDDGTFLDADTLLYACGPWTSNLMSGVKYHSVVLPTSTVLSQCVFFSGCGDPEVYVRPDQTAYCTGFPDPPTQVTESPGHEQVRPQAVERIRQAVQQASNLVADADAVTANACYLPSTPDGLPLMGKLENQPNSYVAAGHSCWGILMGPATGEAMAHLIATGKSPHVDISSFNPNRMGTMKMVPSFESSSSSSSSK